MTTSISVRAGFHRMVNLVDAFFQRREALGKIRGNGSHLDLSALQFAQRRLDESGGRCRPRAVRRFCSACTQALRQLGRKRLSRPGAELAHAFVGIVIGKSGQIHHRNGQQQIALGALADAGALGDGCGGALDFGRYRHVAAVDPIEIESYARILRFQRSVLQDAHLRGTLL